MLDGDGALRHFRIFGVRGPLYWLPVDSRVCDKGCLPCDRPGANQGPRPLLSCACRLGNVISDCWPALVDAQLVHWMPSS
jgi:hypothetical protein